ncbi:UNVERIFIED_CONTAM: hypothetical protein RMT77_011519 [Armadillidium vulgare]
MIYKVLLSSAILTVYFRVCLCVQTWEEEPSYTEVNPGDSATLACKIYNKKGTCSWQKDGKPQGMFVGKIEWAGDQSSGDCSLRVLDASEVDDGHWECQVTASSFSAHDALTSQIARLVVRVAPDAPQFEIGSSKVSQHNNFTVREGLPSSIKCLSRYGNPPGVIKWFLGSEELPTSSYNQSNVTEVDRPKTWTAISVLQTSFRKGDHGRPLRCVSIHEAFAAKNKDATIALDVQYSPTVTLQGSPTGDIEEGIDRVALQCLADANPPANIIWKRIGEDKIFSFQETIEFNPATRKHSGTYTCKASNVVGMSDPLTVRLDVKYPPEVFEIGPDRQVTGVLGNRTVLTCQANGDPKPKYEWFQVTPTGRKVRRGDNSSLTLDPVTYGHQGNYFCVAFSVIKGSRKDNHSKPIAMEVMGAPQVLRYSVEKQVSVNKGDEAIIQMVFCSDPEPLRAIWEWAGGNQLDAGNGNRRFVAERLAKESGSNDCYQARLRIQNVEMTDAQKYHLTVQNEKGDDKYYVSLTVKEPITMSTIIGIVTTCLVILVIVTIIMFYAFKAEKCCFAHLSLINYPSFLSTFPQYSTSPQTPLPTGRAGETENINKDPAKMFTDILLQDLPPLVVKGRHSASFRNASEILSPK